MCSQIMINAPASPCPGKGAPTGADADTISTLSESPASSTTSMLERCSLSSDKSPQTPPRRSIFGAYWKKQQSSLSAKEDDSTDGSTQDRRSATKVEPSYKGVYSFAPPSPHLGPKTPPPGLMLSPLSSTDSLTSPGARPKSILRRNRSARAAPTEGRPGMSEFGRRARSVSCVEPPRATFGNVAPPPFLDDTSDRSGPSKGPDADLKRQHSFVHFDPTITVRECVGDEEAGRGRGQESNWFSENELRTFMVETINVCHSSAVNAIRAYSLRPTQPEYRALFADPVLHATEEDAIVHDGSKAFFKIVAKEMQRVLIVDNSHTTLKLFKRHILCMFPHVTVDTALSAEEALDKIEVDAKTSSLCYDLILVEERLQNVSGKIDEGSSDLSGSELLRLISEMEASASPSSSANEGRTSAKPPGKNRSSLKVGVSCSLGEDCESLRKGGADLFWSKPPPKPSNGLRNGVVNALLSKRGKAVFVCGC
ncbi:hypothetical protein ACHAXT_008724 [Thalassiosira profunda]